MEVELEAVQVPSGVPPPGEKQRFIPPEGVWPTAEGFEDAPEKIVFDDDHLINTTRLQRAQDVTLPPILHFQSILCFVAETTEKALTDWYVICHCDVTPLPTNSQEFLKHVTVKLVIPVLPPSKRLKGKPNAPHSHMVRVYEEINKKSCREMGVQEVKKSFLDSEKSFTKLLHDELKMEQKTAEAAKKEREKNKGRVSEDKKGKDILETFKLLETTINLFLSKGFTAKLTASGTGVSLVAKSVRYLGIASRDPESHDEIIFQILHGLAGKENDKNYQKAQILLCSLCAIRGTPLRDISSLFLLTYLTKDQSQWGVDTVKSLLRVQHTSSKPRMGACSNLELTALLSGKFDYTIPIALPNGEVKTEPCFSTTSSLDILADLLPQLSLKDKRLYALILIHEKEGTSQSLDLRGSISEEIFKIEAMYEKKT